MGKKYLDEAGASYLINKFLELLNNKVDIENGKGLSEENFTNSLKTKLENLENYQLPIASENILGGIKVGTGLNINQGVLSAIGDGTPVNIEQMTTQEIDALFE